MEDRRDRGGHEIGRRRSRVEAGTIRAMVFRAGRAAGMTAAMLLAGPAWAQDAGGGPPAEGQQQPANPDPANPPPADPAQPPAEPAAEQAGPGEPAEVVPEDPNEPGVADGLPYVVSGLDLKYVAPHPGQPALADLENVRVEVTRLAKGLVAPRAGMPTEWIRLGDLGRSSVETLYGSGIKQVGQAVAREINRRGLIVVFVQPSPTQIDTISQEDLRDPEAGPARLTMEINMGVVRKIRTIASGDRGLSGARVDNPAHARVKRASPVRPSQLTPPTISPAEALLEPEAPVEGEPAPDAAPVESTPPADGAAPAEGEPPADAAADAGFSIPPPTPIDPENSDADQQRDLVNKQQLDDYVYRLNRHPGRRVDVAISSLDQYRPNDILLDYLVNESKPWTAYFQLTNTGTAQTDVWRERFGFSHSQLTGRDDVLRLDYITAGFSESHAIIGSYELPIYERLHIRPFGSWNEFTASDVGQAGEKFNGEGWNAGGEVIWNVFQRGPYFIDLVGGARFQRVRTENELTGTRGDETFLLPYIGARFERFTDQASLYGSVNLETTLSHLMGVDQAQVDNLGRPEPDKNWTVFQYDLGTSFFLEPLLYPNATDPAKGATLAHELAFTLRGQWAFENRLIPTAQDVVGGFYTVRGYPESFLAGDSTVVVSAEYRFHVPRAFGIEPDPSKTPVFGQPFRFKPQQAYGSADWDLILRGFVDAGRAENSKKITVEKDETLVGTGVGAELQVLRNFSLRVDWGIALQEADTDNVAGGDRVTVGSNRFHISATLMF